jgi:hypothetical protein
MCRKGRRHAPGVVRWAVAVVMLGVPPGCVVDHLDEPEVGGQVDWGPGPLADRRGAWSDLALPTAESGRFTMRIEQGIVGVAELDTVVEGAFDRRAGASELVIDMDEVAAAQPGGQARARRADAPDRLVIRRVEGAVFVRLGALEREWVVIPPAPAGSVHAAEVVEVADAYDPARLLDVLERASVEVTRRPGGEVDGAGTTLYSGWIRGNRSGDLSTSDGANLEILAGVAPAELADRLFRFDVWVGEADGRPRRLVVEWDLDTLAELAVRIDGTAEGIDRLRFRYVVHWFDLGSPIDIVPPPVDQVAVVDLDAPGAR